MRSGLSRDKLWRQSAAFAVFIIGGAAAPGAAQAQLPGIVSTGLGFLNTGGYFFSGGAGSSRALGTPKFYNVGGYYSKPHHMGNFDISGGLESVNASDHFLPFTGGNEFNLIGPGARVSYGVARARLRPFITFGLFAGRIRSVSRNFDRTEFTPSGSIGVELKLSKSFSLVASYRISQEIQGINTDGFGLGLRIL